MWCCKHSPSHTLLRSPCRQSASPCKCRHSRWSQSRSHSHSPLQSHSHDCKAFEWTTGMWTDIAFTVHDYHVIYASHLKCLQDFDEATKEFSVLKGICAKIYKDGWWVCRQCLYLVTDGLASIHSPGLGQQKDQQLNQTFISLEMHKTGGLVLHVFFYRKTTSY